MSDGWCTRLRWVLVHPEEARVLLARRGGALALPETEVPGQPWTADPEEVLPALASQLGVDAVLLRCLDEAEDEAARVRRATLVAVPRGAAPAPPGTAWAGRDELAAAPDPGGDAAVAATVVADLAAGRSGAALQPWAARGWFGEAGRWLGDTMDSLGRPLTGPVRQARVWELSCVLRAPTAAADVWFKANAELPLFVNEGVVMAALAGLAPRHVPAPLAVDPDRGWMVLDDFGAEVGWAAPVEVAEAVARTFARVQVAAASQVDRLLAAGCQDRRLDRLAAQARAWLPELEADGRLPGIDAATWLTPGERAALAAAVPRLEAACAELAAGPVPPSLVHGDLHLGNVARGPGGYLFFDWTDACVAHPFLDLPTIRRGTAFAEDDGDEELRRRLRDAYLPEWAAFAPPGQLRRAYELAAPLGALHQAVSYRSIAAFLRPPVDPHMARSTAWWLRQVLAGLGDRRR